MKQLDQKGVFTFREVFPSHCVIEVAASHNCFHGGGESAGGECSFSVRYVGGADNPITVDADRFGFGIEVKGDDERRQMAEALIRIGRFLLEDPSF